MRKETSRLLLHIERLRQQVTEIEPKQMRVRLEVRPIRDEDPEINFYLYDSQDPAPKYEGNFRLFCHNPLFFKKATRKAETIASEVWAYFASQGTKCEIRHYPIHLTSS